jgi:hypothetical protein
MIFFTVSVLKKRDLARVGGPLELWQRVCRALATAYHHEEAAFALYTSEALAQSVGPNR